MSNLVFPYLAGQAWPSVRTEMWRTIVQECQSGREDRIGQWSYPRHKWELSHDVLRADSTNLEWQQLLGFFNEMQGSSQSFLYKDQADYSVTDQRLGVGDSVQVDYQLVRTIAGPGNVISYVEPIYSPNALTNVKVDGVTISPSDYTLDTATGILTFDTAPAGTDIVTASFTFYFRARFVMDEMDFEQFVSGLWRTNKVEIISLKGG